MLQLFYAPVCPFAQRARALLEHLEFPYVPRLVDLEQRDPELLQLSPTGLVPLLMEDGLEGLSGGPFVLYESAVIAEFLIERAAWQDAYPGGLALRYQQRLAMKRFDDLLVPLHYRSMRDPSSLSEADIAEIQVEVARLAELVELLGGHHENALAFHVAPFWARMSWMGAHAPMLSLLVESDIVRFWMDRCLEVPAIRRTLPDRDQTVQNYLKKLAGEPRNG
ncbi:MAG: hypothetical protein CSA62_14790 [Planctomycetota bacterium]|nr:MAG: hypothetical protein CSA62_14790 [Planctomycetota bacterium]